MRPQTAPQKSTPWHALEAAETVADLGADERRGLAPAEAVRRLAEHGPNRLPHARRLGVLRILASNLANPIAIVLIVAAVVSLAVGHPVDAAVLGVVIVLNIGFAVVQEYKANQTIERILALIDYRARVVRGGREREISSADVVPGDVLVLKPGMKVAADARLVACEGLTVSEAPLTGESEPVVKTLAALPEATAVADRTNMIFLGTTVDAGHGRAVVTATGIRTELGAIVAMTRSLREPRTPLQEKLARLAWAVTLLLLLSGGGIFALLAWRGTPAIEAFVVVVALVASAVPEGLLPAITIILTVAMRRILKAGSLVRRMAAVESLGSASVICIDKTGTLTEGNMRARELVTADGAYALDGVLPLPASARAVLETAITGIGATVENPADPPAEWRIRGSATEAAVLRAAAISGLEALTIAAAPPVCELPFDSSYKFAAVCAEGRMPRLVVRGAPEILLVRASRIRTNGGDAPLTEAFRSRMLGSILDAMSAGLRVIAVCERPLSGPERRAPKPEEVRDLVFLGAVVLKDPLRPEAAAMLSGAARAGIRTVMVTGDHVATARAIAREVGMPHDDAAVVDGARLERLSDDALRNVLRTVVVFARVTPAQKLRIVQAFQRMGETVAVTGDGVNDAPALNAAEIGIALGTGTDVAKEAADIVLLDNNFRTVLRSVEEGRFAFQNLRKAAVYMLSNNFAEIAAIVGALALGLPLPLTAPQILWINVVESGFLNIGLALEPGEEAVLRDPPRRRGAPFFSRGYKLWLAAICIIVSAVVVAAYPVLLAWTGDLAATRTMLLVTLSLESVFMVFVLRRVRVGAFTRGFFANGWLNAGALTSTALIFVPLAVPALHAPFSTTWLTAPQWIVAVILALAVVLLVEAAKILLIVLPRRRSTLDAPGKVR